MISFNKNVLLALILLTSQTHASNNSFASLITYFKTQFTTLKNSLPTFNVSRFNFKNWFFKKTDSPQQPLIPKKPIAPQEQPLEIIDLADMKFSQPEDPIDADMAELRNLIDQTTIFPNQKKVLAHYTAILDKKWKGLVTNLKQLLLLNPNKLLYRAFYDHAQKAYLKKPYAQEETIKALISDPLKKFAKKDIFLEHMLKPLDDTTKKIFRQEGINDKYLDRIFIIIHKPDPEIPFEFLDKFTGVSHERSLNSKNNIIFLTNKFFENSISEQIFILNHEIAHCNQRQVDRRPYQNLMLWPFASNYPLSLRHFSKTFNEMEADIFGVLQSNVSHTMKMLPNFKRYDAIGLKFFPDIWYPVHRYDIAVTIIKSLITGKVPRDIPDSWINNAGLELKSKIHELEQSQQNKPRAKL